MTARIPIGSRWRGRWHVACVLLVAGAASGSASAGGLAMQARAVPRADAATTTTATQAQPKGTGFTLPRHVVAAGGGHSSGGAFAITGTIGQADADPLQPSSGGVFAITGGFWPGIAPGAPLGDAVFANGFEPATP